ncbi:hypothetical protein TWF730_002665 [Orbilia blumenaviensis]|uniref:Uncharacterized protein n=1 Tax=Orbilia blumenaviensis TaxID=1796055 RepID=A0AAV9U7E8_9PEZI
MIADSIPREPEAPKIRNHFLCGGDATKTRYPLIYPESPNAKKYTQCGLGSDAALSMVIPTELDLTHGPQSPLLRVYPDKDYFDPSCQYEDPESSTSDIDDDEPAEDDPMLSTAKATPPHDSKAYGGISNTGNVGQLDIGMGFQREPVPGNTTETQAIEIQRPITVGSGPVECRDFPREEHVDISRAERNPICDINRGVSSDDSGNIGDISAIGIDQGNITLNLGCGDGVPVNTDRSPSGTNSDRNSGLYTGEVDDMDTVNHGWCLSCMPLAWNSFLATISTSLARASAALSQVIARISKPSAGTRSNGFSIPPGNYHDTYSLEECHGISSRIAGTVNPARGNGFGFIHSIGISTLFQFSFYDLTALNAEGSTMIENLFGIYPDERIAGLVRSWGLFRIHRGVLHLQNESIISRHASNTSTASSARERPGRTRDTPHIKFWLAHNREIRGPLSIEEIIAAAPRNLSVVFIDVDEFCTFVVSQLLFVQKPNLNTPFRILVQYKPSKF